MSTGPVEHPADRGAQGLWSGGAAGVGCVPHGQLICKSLAPAPLSHYYNACSLSQRSLELYAYAISTLHRELYRTTVEWLSDYAQEEFPPQPGTV